MRRPFDEFFKRYRCIDLLTPNLDALLATLEAKGVLKAGEWAKGHSKVFCRTEQSGQLEYAREVSLTKVATIVQKNTRRMIARRKFKSWKKILENVAAAIVQRQEEPLAKIIDMAFELPSGGGHLAIIKQAKVLLARLREEKRVTQLLEKAIESRNIDSLKSAIAVHAGVHPAFDTPLAGKAKAVLERLEAELAIKAALIAAIQSRSKTQLEETIRKCIEMQYECNELTQAQALVKRLEEELALIATLNAACAVEDLHEINSIFNICMEQGMDTYYAQAMGEARKVKQTILARIAAEEEERKRREEEEERQRAALAAIEAKRVAAISASRDKLKATIESRDIAKINTVLQETIQAGYNFPEVEEARSMLELLKNVNDVKSQLQAAIKTLEVQAESGINMSDLAPLAHAIEMAEKVRMEIWLIFLRVYSHEPIYA
jgi:myosin heavy subunit